MTVPRPLHRKATLAALILTALCGTTALHAAPQVVNAEDLDLSLPCLGRVDITVDPAMSDGVSLDSAATGGAHVTIRTGKTEGASRVLIASKSCAPKAVVSILVAPNVGVMLHDSHDTHVVINGTLASLEASLESGQLDADTIQSLDLSLRGTEQIHIAHLNRAAQVVASGASGLVVDHADLDAFSGQFSESSHLSITDGRFDVLTLMVNNAASAQIGGTVNTATVAANGTGLVAIPRVTGALAKTGTVQVGPIAAPPAHVKPVPQPSPQPPVAVTAQPAAPALPPDTGAAPQTPNLPQSGQQMQQQAAPLASQRVPESRSNTLPPQRPAAGGAVSSDPITPTASDGSAPAKPLPAPAALRAQQDRTETTTRTLQPGTVPGESSTTPLTSSSPTQPPTAPSANTSSGTVSPSRPLTAPASASETPPSATPMAPAAVPTPAPAAPVDPAHVDPAHVDPAQVNAAHLHPQQKGQSK